MVTRQLTNYPSSPLQRADGTPASGVQITLRLCVGDSDPDPTTVEYGGTWDAITAEPIISTSLTTVTDADGFFTIDLWPNDRGSTPTGYLFTINDAAFAPFVSSMPSAPELTPTLAYSFYDFFTTSNLGALGPVGSVTPVLDTHFDGILYGRQNRVWVAIPPSAPLIVFGATAPENPVEGLLWRVGA